MSDTLPVIDSVALNKTSYGKGETMVLTVTGHDPDEEVVEVTVVLRSRGTGAESVPATTAATIDELEAVAVDTGERTWTLTSRVGATFTLTATA